MREQEEFRPESTEPRLTQFVSIDQLFPEAKLEDLPTVIEPSDYDHEGWKDFGRESSAAFAQEVLVIMERNIEAATALREVFRDQIVVDIGAGKRSFGYEFSLSVEARAYVAIEPFLGKDLEKDITRFDQERIPSQHKIPVAIVPEDGLTFLRRLPDNSASLFLSGIDDVIIPNREYMVALFQEMQRVLSEKGGILRIHPSTWVAHFTELVKTEIRHKSLVCEVLRKRT